MVSKLIIFSVKPVFVLILGRRFSIYIRYQSQLVVLAAQISWSESVEKALQGIEQKGDGDVTPLSAVLAIMEATLNVLADSVLHEQPPVRRKKLEHLVGAGHCMLPNYV